jgi:hypothetical protein
MPQKFDPTPIHPMNASVDVDACVIAPRFHVRNTQLPSRNGNLNKVSIQRSTKRLVSKRVPSQYLSAGDNGAPDPPNNNNNDLQREQSKDEEKIGADMYLFRQGEKQMFIYLNFSSMAATCALLHSFLIDKTWSKHTTRATGFRV